MLQNLVPKGHIETLQMTHIPQMLAAYIQYKYIYITECTFPNPAPKRCTETLQITQFPHFLEGYIQYQYIDSTDIYIPQI